MASTLPFHPAYPQQSSTSRDLVAANDDTDSNMQVDSDIDADGEYLAQSEHIPSDPEPQPVSIPSTSIPLHNDPKGLLPRPDFSADPELYGLRRSERDRRRDSSGSGYEDHSEDAASEGDNDVYGQKKQLTKKRPSKPKAIPRQTLADSDSDSDYGSRSKKKKLRVPRNEKTLAMAQTLVTMSWRMVRVIPTILIPKACKQRKEKR